MKGKNQGFAVSVVNENRLLLLPLVLLLLPKRTNQIQ